MVCWDRLRRLLEPATMVLQATMGELRGCGRGVMQQGKLRPLATKATTIGGESFNRRLQKLQWFVAICWERRDDKLRSGKQFVGTDEKQCYNKLFCVQDNDGEVRR